MEITILGAGCSGSSLAYLLVRGGFAGEIHVFDGRTDFSREQRWCSWGPIPSPLAGLVDASWPRWKVLSGRREVRCSLPQRPYLHVHAPRFYRHVHDAETLGDLVPWSCASVAIVASVALGTAPAGVQLWPWLDSIAMFGLPHGACDHLVAARIGGDYRSERTTIAAAFFPLTSPEAVP